jgi:hypothetical protein
MDGASLGGAVLLGHTSGAEEAPQYPCGDEVNADKLQQ